VEYRYLDVIWLDNLLLNFIVLWITWKLSGNVAPMWRLWCSACIGAVYAVLIVLPGFPALTWLPFKLLLSLAMLAVGFRIPTWKAFIKLFGFFYGTTFVLGGAAFGLYYFFGAEVEFNDGIFVIHDFPVKILVFSTVFVILLYRWLWPLLLYRLNRHQLIYKVEVWFGDSSICTDAFLDTGNKLTDPISGFPVIVMEYEQVKAVLPPEVQKIFHLGKEDNLEYITRVMADSQWISRFRIVPYHTLNSPESMLIAFRPDKARIQSEDAVREIRDILIGIRNKKLSEGSEYHALIQPQIIP
jgi:stage II sporulation protein GA (sporulation sigma-E factor processing peptidase)